MRDWFYYTVVAVLVVFFVAVCIGLVRTMNANDKVFDAPAPVVKTAR